jgi:hypothetical protein
MREDFIRDLRERLEKRVRRLNAATPEQFIDDLKRFLHFLMSTAALSEITRQLERTHPNCVSLAGAVFNKGHYPGSSYEANAATALGVLRGLVGRTFPNYLNIGPIEPGRDVTTKLDELKKLYLEPLCDYLDEHLGDWDFIASSLIRYKYSCEWFRRENLYQLWNENKQRGERLLTNDMYEYLYERGIEFHVEPRAVSGRPDIVSDTFVAEAKIFNPAEGHDVSYLKQGFRQIYQYTCDYNRAAGHLVIFNTSDRILTFALSQSGEPLQRIVFSQKTIFFLVIDIFPHAEPASRRLAPQSVHVVEKDIVEAMALPPQSDSSVS